MSRRLLALLLAGVLAGAGCASATPVPSAGPTATGLAPSHQPTPGTAGAATPAPTTARPVDITTTTYRPEPVGHAGGTLTIGTNVTPPPTSQLPFGWVEWPLAMVSLWDVTPDDRYVPQLATQVPTIANGGVVLRSDGRMDVTIDLVPGARWSDGQPITCEDLDHQADLTSGIGILDVEGASGPRCVAHFVRPSLDYLHLWFPLLPAHYLEGRDLAEPYPTTDVALGVYGGPYMPTRVAEGKEIHFVPNPQYWATIGKGEPPFDSVVIRYYRTSDAEIAAFADGEVDVALDLMSPDLPKVASFPPGQVDAIDAAVSMSTIWNRAALVAAWGEAGAGAILQALHYAYDKQAIADRVLAGVVDPVCNPVSALLWYHADTGSCYGYDPARANQILDAAGFARGPDGVRARDGKPLAFRTCTEEAPGMAGQVRIDVLTLLGRQLDEVGIRLNPPLATEHLWAVGGQVETETACNFYRGTFDVALVAWPPYQEPPTYFIHYYHTPSKGDENWSRVESEVVDRVFDSIETSVDFAAIRDAMGVFQAYAADPANGFPEIPLYQVKAALLRGPRMHNVSATWAYPTWNIADWWRAP